VRVLLDTNILVSAALFPEGIAARAFELAVSGMFVQLVNDDLRGLRDRS
jgi:predicted nucleic acid-binding protein